MNRIVRSTVIGVFLLAFIHVASAPGQQQTVSENRAVSEPINRGQKVRLEGVVVSRNRDVVTVQTMNSDNVEVELTDYTKVATPEGLLGKRRMPISDLVPGLWVKVKGVGNDAGHVLAESVTFSTKDLRTANAIQAGLLPLQAKVESNQAQIQASEQKIGANQEQIQTHQQQIQNNQEQIQQTAHNLSEVANYEVKYQGIVYFPAGSAALSQEAQSELSGLAQYALQIKGYFLQVKGFADSSGGAALNQDLSMRRSQSVIAYLESQGNIPLARILTPAGLGDSQPMASNRTPQGRAANRRVQIDVLISRGLAASQPDLGDHTHWP
jgi:OmpA-OmpF porin, OOP family